MRIVPCRSWNDVYPFMSVVDPAGNEWTIGDLTHWPMVGLYSPHAPIGGPPTCRVDLRWISPPSGIIIQDSLADALVIILDHFPGTELIDEDG
jgi:hypothetical protein